jgi:hypothetical protein
MDRTDAAIAALAKQQHGVFTRAQALALGTTRHGLEHRLSRGTVELAHRGVYRIAGAPETWRQQVSIACLAAGGGSAASHRTAGALWPFDGCRPGPVEITVPTSRNLALPGVIVHRKHDLVPVDVTLLDGIPVTTPARTLVDLAAVLRHDALEEAVDSAVRDGLTSKSRLWWRWGELRRRGRDGIALMGEVLEGIDGAPVPRSVLERRFLRAIAGLGLPRVESQYVIKRPDGSHVATIDFALPPVKVGFEVDGHGSHATRKNRRRDSRQRNEIHSMGWTLYTFTYEQVCFEPEYIAATAADALLCAVRPA